MELLVEGGIIGDEEEGVGAEEAAQRSRVARCEQPALALHHKPIEFGIRGEHSGPPQQMSPEHRRSVPSFPMKNKSKKSSKMQVKCRVRVRVRVGGFFLHPFTYI